MWSRRTSTAVLAAMVVVAALTAWSCGGSYESPTAPAVTQEAVSPAAPVAAQAGDEAGAVTSSCRTPRKITICHKGQTMQVTLAALFGHLRHKDKLGACATPVATCPCFTAAGIADIAAQCSGTPTGNCGAAYSLSLFCPAGSSVGNLGSFEAIVNAGQCSTTTTDPMSGESVTTQLPVTAAQFEACKQAILGSPYYPTTATCPR